MPKAHVAGSALNKAPYLIVGQLFSKLATFLMKVFVVRHVTKELIGVAEVDLYMTYTTILFLSREGLRVVAGRTDPLESVKTREARVENLVWHFTLNVAIILALIVPLMMNLRYKYGQELNIHYYASGLAVCAVAAVVEMLIEHHYLRAQMRLLIEIQSAFEAISSFVRCLTIAIFVIYFGFDLMSFALGQFAYSICMVILYTVYFNKYAISHQETEPIDIDIDADEDVADEKLKTLTISFMWQSVYKFLLTEGEKFALMLRSDATDQGEYIVVQNLGSLVVRLIFKPLEDSSKTEFSRLLNQGTGPKSKALTDEMRKRIKFDAERMLLNLLKVVTFIGLLAASFGPNYSFILIHILYGDKYSNSEVPRLLSFYCGYLVLLAVNGILEAFLFSVISKKRLEDYNYWMVVMSVTYIILSFILAVYGSKGVLLANSLNMCMRIGYAGNYIRRYFNNFSVGVDVFSIFPSNGVCLSLLLGHVVTRLTFSYFELEACRKYICFAKHIGVAFACLFVIFLVLVITDKRFARVLRLDKILGVAKIKI